MKAFVLAVLLTLPVTAASASQEKSCDVPRAVAIVDGMVCDFCAQSLKKVFLKNDDVTDVQIDLTTKEVKILLKPGTSIDDAAIKKNVDWAGYKVSGISRDCAGKS